MNHGGQTASHMRKQQHNDLSLEMKLSRHQERYTERVEDFVARTGSNIETEVRLNDVGQSCQSMKNIHYGSERETITKRSRKEKKKQENQSTSQNQSVKTYKSTTNQEILSKYDITQIVKRKQQEEQQNCKTCKTVAKVVFMILFFPITLVWLLATCIVNKCQQNIKNKQKIGLKSSRKFPPIPNSPNCCTRSMLSIQSCCANCFCYYLCCQCCQDCHCCTKCCRKIQKCLECMCENSCMETLQEFFHCCFVRSCERCCRCICCHRRTHERIDTIERLEKMSDRVSESKIIAEIG